MDENSGDDQTLIARIRQLENERDELHKDIEQLCMQQAGPGYLGVATRMHFQRTAGLEQEIENLKKKLAVCTRENHNLQEELTEVYHIKSQLADLHSSELSKNAEAEKQLKFFQSCVAGAFSERDTAIMEAEKANEKEEMVSRELSTLQTRIEELTSKLFQENELMEAMKIDHDTRERQIDPFRKVIEKFYAIRQQSVTFNEEVSLEDKCECLLHDSTDLWSFRDEHSISKYIKALEQEVETLRRSGDNYEKNLRMGMAIENHLKKQISIFKKEKENKKKSISALRDYHLKHKSEVVKLLDECDSYMKSTIKEVEEKIGRLDFSSEQKSMVVNKPVDAVDPSLDESECRDVHINNEINLDSTNLKDEPYPLTTTTICVEASKAFSQALQEKVAALLLLSQEEERHLLERNVNVALQRKVEELQRNLLQVTHEKVKTLMEFAQLKQEYQILQENIKDGKFNDEIVQKGFIQEKEGRLKNLLKKTYLAHWVEKTDPEREGAYFDGDISRKKYNYDADFARMKIENAALKESVESMVYLTSTVRKLHLSLLKIKESGVCTEGSNNIGSSKAVDDIINEAKLVKTALGSSLPISWAAEVDIVSQVDRFEETRVNFGSKSRDYCSNEKVDIVTAAGFEMLQLLLFAAQTWKECLANNIV